MIHKFQKLRLQIVIITLCTKMKKKFRAYGISELR